MGRHFHKMISCFTLVFLRDGTCTVDFCVLQSHMRLNRYFLPREQFGHLLAL